MKPIKALFLKEADAIDCPVNKPLVQWCEENLVISPRQPSPFHGPYCTALTPWVRGILEALADPQYWMVVLRKGTQSGGTQTGFAWLCNAMVNDPGPMMIVFPSEDDAKSASDTRFMPLVEDSPEVAKCLTVKKDDFKKLEYKFRRSVLRWIGANSASKLASRPIRYLHITEIDKFKATIGKEGSVADLAIQRTKRFFNRKIYIESSPTVKGNYITRYFLKGDQRQYHVPCPKCKKLQVIHWASHVKFDSKLPPQEAGAGAYFQCEHCGAKFGDEQKKVIIDKGKWKATAKAPERGVASFDLNGMIPTLPGSELAGMVEKFLSVRHDMTELQSFINSDLGEVWEEQPKAEVDRGAIWQMRDLHKYARGTIPVKGWFKLWLTVDVQEYFVPFNVWAIGPRDQALVDHGRLDILSDLDDMFKRRWQTEDHKDCSLDGVVIDTGFKTDDVYKFVKRVQKRGIVCVPVKGEQGVITSSSEMLKINELQSAPGIHLAHLHCSKWHDMAGAALARLEPEEGQTILDAWNAREFRMHFHAEIDRDYVNSLTAEVVMEDDPDKRGLVRRYWKRIRKDNHDFDMFRYGLVARYLMRGDFQALEDQKNKPKETEEEQPAQRKGKIVRQDSRNQAEKDFYREQADAEDDRVSLPDGDEETRRPGDEW
jgi:phage terminase large subunit GpA-like protein